MRFLVSYYPRARRLEHNSPSYFLCNFNFMGASCEHCLARINRFALSVRRYAPKECYEISWEFDTQFRATQVPVGHSNTRSTHDFKSWVDRGAALSLEASREWYAQLLDLSPSLQNSLALTNRVCVGSRNSFLLALLYALWLNCHTSRRDVWPCHVRSRREPQKSTSTWSLFARKVQRLAWL